ncbi:MAG: hypothetical protein Q9208_003102 [Pyrenodesmia sp. 3 TL-2023]
MTSSPTQTRGSLSQTPDWAFCLVCGGPLLDDTEAQMRIRKAKRAMQTWKNEERRLQSLAWLKDLRYAGSVMGFLHSGQIYAADGLLIPATRRLIIRVWDWDWVPPPKSRQYTLHAACAEILSRTFQSQSNRAVGSTRGLYLALEGQYQILAAYLDELEPSWTDVHNLLSMEWPHHFFGASKSQLGAWKYKESGLEEAQYEANPQEIPCLTEYIISKLRPFKRVACSNSMGLEQLPQEIHDIIDEYISWPMVADPDPRPTRFQNAGYWMQLLVSGKVLPWLWDLDEQLCKTKHAQKRHRRYGEDWDWELLIRQLAQTEVFEEGNLMSDAPLGLRNRRRIWRCCNEMAPREDARRRQAIREENEEAPEEDLEAYGEKAAEDEVLEQDHEEVAEDVEWRMGKKRQRRLGGRRRRRGH